MPQTTKDHIEAGQEIAISNAETAIDQRHDYDSIDAAIAAYAVNVIDTLQERGIQARNTAMRTYIERTSELRAKLPKARRARR